MESIMYFCLILIYIPSWGLRSWLLDLLNKWNKNINAYIAELRQSLVKKLSAMLTLEVWLQITSIFVLQKYKNIDENSKFHFTVK